MVVEERTRLHRLPDTAFTAAFGETRKASWTSMISFGGIPYSVPHTLADQVVWVRVDGDAHYPPRRAGALARQPKPTNAGETEFLDSVTANAWLVEAAAAGTSRVKVKMAEAVQLARLHGVERVDWALGHAAAFERFADGDTASIITAHLTGQRRRADEEHPMQPSTRAWENFGEAAS